MCTKDKMFIYFTFRKNNLTWSFTFVRFNYSVYSLIRTDINVTLCCRIIGQGTNVLNCQSWYNYHELLLQYWSSPKFYLYLASYELWTSHAPTAQCNISLHIRIVHLVWTISVHLWLTWDLFRFRISTNGFPFPFHYSKNPSIVPAFVLCIILWSASCWVSLCSVWITCI